MEKNKAILAKVLLAAAVVAIVATTQSARGAGRAPELGDTPTAIPPVANPCPRVAAGSVVENPPALFSHNGALIANFSYQTTTDEDGRALFCFMTPDGLENPTLHVRPGDDLIINVTNNSPAAPVEMQIDPPNCGATEITGSSVNIHYHGTS
jgi:FtsP/CotA-like multicopper oxidase with cupredoxin domain